ncbi:MAG: sulfatase-like hydrolase/transferase [Paludibacteraceae bacterium]|nr:sulfatase-like hydrolase/transferase [Paludibacteraceae bacterium]
MLQKLIHFFKTYLLILFVFLLQKPLFILYNHHIYSHIRFSDLMQIMLHGLKLDTSMSAYLTILPGIFLIISLWAKPSVHEYFQKIYFGLISTIISIVFVVDAALYPFWGFRLDSTVLFYMKWPKEVLASIDIWMIVVGLLAIILIAFALYKIFYFFIIKTEKKPKPIKSKFSTAALLFLFTCLLFIPIRGGFNVSTMNVSKVYFSSKNELNHAAINPMFNFLESAFKTQNFDKQYRFMSDAEAEEEFKHLIDQPVKGEIPALFTSRKPNVIFVVLESFMSKDLESLGGFPGIAVRMNNFCNEGVLFTNFYANSFRTDRGLISIFSGYPAQPTTSIMKYPKKSQTLPSIPKTLKAAGYDLEYYYGGDVDFTNMRAYLIAQGIHKMVVDKDFPAKDRTTKWGAHDHIVFQRLAKDLKKEQKEPFMKIFQTLSSHEPFDVPFHKNSDPYLNSVQYTDSCLGAFVDEFRKTKYWENTILVLVPDHAMHYPKNILLSSVERYQIPLLIIGGAIKSPMKINTYASQIDIAATLLYQLGLPHQDFTFSKNILNPASPHFAFYTFPNGFGFLTPENHYVFDCNTNQVLWNSGQPNANKKKGEAYLQMLYNDLSKR